MESASFETQDLRTGLVNALREKDIRDPLAVELMTRWREEREKANDLLLDPHARQRAIFETEIEAAKIFFEASHIDTALDTLDSAWEAINGYMDGLEEGGNEQLIELCRGVGRQMREEYNRIAGVRKEDVV
jgi:hypothetical protein